MLKVVAELLKIALTRYSDIVPLQHIFYEVLQISEHLLDPLLVPSVL
jgi:hypothetical protein